MMIIKENDFIQSIADALQVISYTHPPDFLKALFLAYQRERAPAARDALAQILINSKLCALKHRPLCQDTGSVIALIKIGMNVRWDAQHSIQELVDEGVRRAYRNSSNPLRASMVAPAAGARCNTGDNTPAIVHIEIIPGDRVWIKLAAKGAGSENKARFTVLNPQGDLVAWVIRTVSELGAGWCPPGIIGLGVGGSAEKAMLLAKESLFEAINIQELIARGPANFIEELRLIIYEKINKLGIGAQGLGGVTTVLDVKILSHPTHAASLPVALIPNCVATRHLEFMLDGKNSVIFPEPDLSSWPEITWDPTSAARRVNLATITRDEIKTWKAGERLLLSGKLLTGRDAAHQKIVALLAQNAPLPAGINLQGRFLYYVGPVDPVKDEVIGPAGPTTATRMDGFTEAMLTAGLLGMIGKAERSSATITLIKKYNAVYLTAVGGAAYLIAQKIRKVHLLAFAELGMEAVYEFEVLDFPVTVAVDSQGTALHQIGPATWATIN